MTTLGWLTTIYLAGVVLFLIVLRDRFPDRLMVAIAWPFGLLAFAIVIIILLAALPVAFPRFALVFGALILLALWIV